jgi:polyisoprenoid-binding protein YceI
MNSAALSRAADRAVRLHLTSGGKALLARVSRASPATDGGERPFRTILRETPDERPRRGRDNQGEMIADLRIRPTHRRVEPSRSTVGFRIRKLGAGTVHGRFTDFEGALDGDAACGTVGVASIATGDADRDAHLLRLFAADEHPRIAFEARLGEQRVAGELTIRGRTRPVVLQAATDGGRLRLTGEIDRRDFGLTWNRAIEATGAVGTKVGLELDLELSRRPG